MKSSGIALRKTKRRAVEFLTFLSDIPGSEKSRTGCQGDVSNLFIHSTKHITRWEQDSHWCRLAMTSTSVEKRLIPIGGARLRYNFSLYFQSWWFPKGESLNFNGPGWWFYKICSWISVLFFISKSTCNCRSGSRSNRGSWSQGGDEVNISRYSNSDTQPLKKYCHINV